jgi:hypothetical protein
VGRWKVDEGRKVWRWAAASFILLRGARATRVRLRAVANVWDVLEFGFLIR